MFWTGQCNTILNVNDHKEQGSVLDRAREQKGSILKRAKKHPGKGKGAHSRRQETILYTKQTSCCLGGYDR